MACRGGRVPARVAQAPQIGLGPDLARLLAGENAKSK
jgi:hypothetical protein